MLLHKSWPLFGQKRSFLSSSMGLPPQVKANEDKNSQDIPR